MERMASIELALKNETMEREFYLNEAKRSKNPLAQAMFAQLAKDEEEHMHRIRGLHEKLIGAGNWPKDVPIQVAGTDIKKVLDTLVAKAVAAGGTAPRDAKDSSFMYSNAFEDLDGHTWVLIHMRGTPPKE